MSPADFFRCPNCYEEGGLIEIDGAAVAEQLRQEVNLHMSASGRR